MAIRKALKRPANSLMAVAGTAKRIEEREKGKGASLSAPPPKVCSRKMGGTSQVPGDC